MVRSITSGRLLDCAKVADTAETVPNKIVPLIIFDSFTKNSFLIAATP